MGKLMGVEQLFVGVVATLTGEVISPGACAFGIFASS